MEIETLFTHPKWKLIQEISKKPSSPQELSQKMQTSMANVSQQLKLLEAMQLIKRESIPNNAKGKPKALYSIREDYAYLISFNDQNASKQKINLNPINEYYINSITQLKQSDHEILQKFFWQQPEILSKCSISFIRSDEAKIELFIITENHLDHFRKTHANQEITLDTTKKTIIIWSHNESEIKKGIETKDVHFTFLINNAKILIDKTRIIKKHKEELKKIHKQ